MKKLSVVIVGYGGFGQYLHKAWQEIAGVQVKAICDLQKQTNIHPEIVYFQNFHELAQANGIDLLSIATPPNSHSEMAIFAELASKTMPKTKNSLLNTTATSGSPIWRTVSTPPFFTKTD